MGVRGRAWLLVTLYSLSLMALIYLLLAYISIGSNAISWHASVEANGSSWSIERESMTMKMAFLEASRGRISSLNVTPQGRAISGYHSRYANIELNDVGLKERTDAKEGSLSYMETTEMRSSTEADLSRDTTMPKGSQVITFKFTEEWPVFLTSRRNLSYSGLGINDRDYGGNNMDFAGTSFLYNSRMMKDRTYSMSLQRMNITVESTNDSIINVGYLPVRRIRYMGVSFSDGISELKYGQASNDQLSLTKGRVNYDRIGQQRYYGLYKMLVDLNATAWNTILYQNGTWMGELCEDCEFVETEDGRKPVFDL